MSENVWEKNYQQGRFNRYPYDEIVSFLLSTFPAPARAQTKVLDLGCGGGNNYKFMCAEGFDAYGVDGSATSVKLTKEFASAPAEKVLVASFTALPFPDATFDCVIDRQSLGHNMHGDILKIAAEIERVLRPGGWYFGQVFSDQHPHLHHGRKLNDLGDYCDFTGGVFTKSGQVHFFNIEQIKEVFGKFELRDVLRKTNLSELGGKDSLHSTEIFNITARKPH